MRDDAEIAEGITSNAANLDDSCTVGVRVEARLLKRTQDIPASSHDAFRVNYFPESRARRWKTNVPLLGALHVRIRVAKQGYAAGGGLRRSLVVPMQGVHASIDGILPVSC